MQKNEVEYTASREISFCWIKSALSDGGKPRSSQQSSALLSDGAQQRGPLKLQTLNVHSQVQHLFLLPDLLLLKRHLVGFLLCPPFLFREAALKLITDYILK